MSRSLKSQSNPAPAVGDLWIVRSDMGLPNERRIILVTRVYEAQTDSDNWSIKYTPIDGLLDGRVIEKLGAGWLERQLYKTKVGM